jgi:hypothetical protein
VKDFHPVFQKVDDVHPEMGYRLERLMVFSVDDEKIVVPQNLNQQPQAV